MTIGWLHVGVCVWVCVLCTERANAPRLCVCGAQSWGCRLWEACTQTHRLTPTHTIKCSVLPSMDCILRHEFFSLKMSGGGSFFNIRNYAILIFFYISRKNHSLLIFYFSINDWKTVKKSWLLSGCKT